VVDVLAVNSVELPDRSEVRISGHLPRKHSGFVDRRNHYEI
jgi:hypothetical protein